MLSPSGPLYLESQARGTEGEGSPRLRQKRRKIEDLMLTKDTKQNNFIGVIHFAPLCIVPHETQIELCKILHFWMEYGVEIPVVAEAEAGFLGYIRLQSLSS